MDSRSPVCRGLWIAAALVLAMATSGAEAGDPPDTNRWKEVKGPSWKFRLPPDWSEVSDPAYAEKAELVVPKRRDWVATGASEPRPFFSISTVGILRLASEGTAADYSWDLGPHLPPPGSLIEVKVPQVGLDAFKGDPVFLCQMDMLVQGTPVLKGVGIHIPTPKGVFALEYFGRPQDRSTTEETLRRIVSTLELSTPTLAQLDRDAASAGWSTVVGMLIVAGLAYLIHWIRSRRQRRERDGRDEENPEEHGEEDLERLESVRRRHLQVERLLRGWGKGLVVAYSVYLVVTIVGHAKAPSDMPPPGGIANLLGNLSIGLLLVLTGRLLWLLHPLGQVLITLICAIMVPGLLVTGANLTGMLALLVVGAIPTVLAWTGQGQVVFSERYRTVVMPSTRHVLPGKARGPKGRSAGASKPPRAAP